MAVAAETVKQTFQEQPERLEMYAESLRSLAQLACKSEVDCEFEKQREVVFDDYVFAVTEMAATDPDYRESLDVDQRKIHPVINKRVCAANGEPMVVLIARGAATARQQGITFQAVRDTGDELNAEAVDQLFVGWTRFAPTMDPKQAFQDTPEQAKQLGYKKGMMYWQRYSHTTENTVETGSHSVDMSDLTLWSGVIQDFFGIYIPPDTPPDEWIRHGFEIECSTEEAEQVVLAMREEYYKRCGKVGTRKSVSEYVTKNIATLQQIFDSYYGPLAAAIESGENNEVMSDLALSMLQPATINKLKPEVRQQLIAVANSKKFNASMGRTMNSILRYVSVEELRKGLPSYLSQSDTNEKTLLPTNYSGSYFVPQVPLEVLNQQLAANLHAGVQARRSYGGCAGQIELGIDEINANQSNKQEAYGGKSCPEVKDGQITKCPHCKKMVRAIVPDRQTIYCGNRDCKLAAPALRKASQLASRS